MMELNLMKCIQTHKLLITILAILIVQSIHGLEDKNVTTFLVANTTAENVELFYNANNSHIATYLSAYKNNKCIRIIQGTTFTGNNIRPENNGFITSVIRAYNLHHNLVLRPDDIWTAILVQFSSYVNGNAEKYREKFVNFTGKKELTVNASGTLDTTRYDQLVDSMTNEIHKNIIDNEVKDWILPNFTTTTKDDNVTCGVILMATLKKYFDYKFKLVCGIPSITLEGNVEDWMKIKQRLKKLETYNLSKWMNMLEPIIEQFIQAKSGNIDKEYWQKICHYRSGSGEAYVSGWITVFSVFDIDGNWQGDAKEGKLWPEIDTDKIAPGIVEVDVTVDDNAIEYKSVMFAGHMASEGLKDGYTIQPRSGWVIALKAENNTSTKTRKMDSVQIN